MLARKVLRIDARSLERGAVLFNLLVVLVELGLRALEFSLGILQRLGEALRGLREPRLGELVGGFFQICELRFGGGKRSVEYLALLLYLAEQLQATRGRLEFADGGPKARLQGCKRSVEVAGLPVEGNYEF